MATLYNITGSQGDYIELSLNAVDSNGSIINLSGYEVRGQVRASYGSTGIILDLQPTITNDLSGIILINISSTGMAVLPVNDYVYDIEKYPSGNPLGNAIKILKGKFFVSPEVTR